MSSGRPKAESGTAIVEFVWLALLLMVPLLYIVLATFDAQRTAYAASAAARSASRAYVEAADQETGRARAQAAAALAFADQGLPGASFDLRIRCEPEPGRCLAPGSVVTVEVSAAAALPLMPAVFGGAPPAVSVEAAHSSPYGTFREARR